jgi:crotonobetaine/carnitine-CoA ligase
MRGLVKPRSSEPESVIGVLQLQAEHRGDAPFLVDGAAQWSYGDVHTLAKRRASAFAEMGVGRGDTVAFFMENSAQQAISSFAVNILGGIWSPANIDYRGEWLASNLIDIASDVLVVDAHLLPLVNELSDLSFKHVIVNGQADVPVAGGATPHEIASLDEYSEFDGRTSSGIGETTAVLWTSGTTGKSKGVMQSNHSWLLWSRRHNEVFRAGIRDGERFYGCTPMYNSGGWIMNIYPALVSGSATCIDKKFSVSNFWDRVRFYGANHAMLLGTMHLYLWNAPAAADDADNPIRTMMMNPVIPAILEPFMERFGIERVFGGFGQSEVMGATTYHSDMPGLKPGSCGYVRDGDPVQTTLLDDDDRPVPVGEVGEICVRPNEPYALYSGYFNQPEETLKSWRNMWHHTGDLGRVDEDGELFFVDRKKDSLRHKGRNTSTFEVEHIARQHPAVAQVAAVGVALEDFASEEELKICLVAQEGQHIDPLEFCKFMDAKAPYFFVPRYVEVLDALPMTPTNKVQKFKLRERGNTSATWDRETAAPHWKPTRHR